jgi:hypothetical protein
MARSGQSDWPIRAMSLGLQRRFARDMRTTTDTLRFDARLNGPPHSLDGGFACGASAGIRGDTASVGILRPVPLEEPLEVLVDLDGESAEVTDSSNRLLATATKLDPFTMIAPVRPRFGDAEEARAATHSTVRATWCAASRWTRRNPWPLKNHRDVVAPLRPARACTARGVGSHGPSADSADDTTTTGRTT